MLGRIQQYHLENERLLSEYRAQKKEVEQLRADRNRLLQQQAETEKLAAKLQSQLNERSNIASQRPDGLKSQAGNLPRLAQDPRHDFSSTHGLPRTNLDSGNAASATAPFKSPNTGLNGLNWRPIQKNPR